MIGTVHSVRTGNVLLVEDNLRLSNVLTEILTAYGFATDHVASAAEARLRLHHLRPDVVVIDLGLPDGEGLELISTIRSNPSTRGLPVIGLTVASTFGEGTRPLAAGMTRFLTGPLDPDGFAEQVQSSIDLGRAWRDRLR